METWKPSREGHYEVSDAGRVRNAATGHVVTPWSTPTGYLIVGIGKRLREYVHRLVAEAFVPGKIDGFEVNHLDGNKANNSASNLEWVSHSANQRHAYRVLGTLRTNLVGHPGEENGQSKLSDEDVLAIRAAAADGERQRSIAARYGIAQGNVSRICTRRSWAHVA